MQRELNPQLFGSSTPVEKIGQPVDPQQPAAGIMGRGYDQNQAAGRQVPYPSIDVKALEHHINTLRVALIQMEKKTDLTNSKLEDLARNTHARLERFGLAILKVEESQSRSHQESMAKFAQISGRVNEGRITDSKVQELMDRHNQIIRNFENRLLSLQRLVSEQEMTLHNSQASLEEARNEIARLKRL